MMEELNSIEARWLYADRLLDEGRISEGKEVLEAILADEPGYGRAHSHLGWIAGVHFGDWPAAERHFRLAVKFSPEFAPGHFHLARYLLTAHNWAELDTHVAAALEVTGTDNATLLDILGNGLEMQGRYLEALRAYERAIVLTLDLAFAENLRESCKRVMYKAPRSVKVVRALGQLRTALFL